MQPIAEAGRHGNRGQGRQDGTPRPEPKRAPESPIRLESSGCVLGGDPVTLVVGLAAARGPLGGAEICGVEDDASGLVARRFFCAARLDEPPGELRVLYTVPC